VRRLFKYSLNDTYFGLLSSLKCQLVGLDNSRSNASYYDLVRSFEWLLFGIVLGVHLVLSSNLLNASYFDLVVVSRMPVTLNRFKPF